MEFVRKAGFHLRSDAQVVGEVCYELEKQGRLTPKDLVAASRPKNAPLHNEFEWNDTAAAAKYREVQAGYIIRSVAIKVSEVATDVEELKLRLTSKAKEPVARFFHAVDLDGLGYDSLETIGNDPDKTDRLLRLCMKDLRNFRDKYCILRSVLPDLFSSIDMALENEV